MVTSIENLINLFKNKGITFSIYGQPKRKIDVSDADFTIIVSSIKEIRNVETRVGDLSFFVQTYEHLFDLVKWEQLSINKPVLGKLGGQYILYQRLLDKETFWREESDIDITPVVKEVVSKFNPDSYYIDFAWLDLGIQDIGWGMLENQTKMGQYLIKKGKERITKVATNLKNKVPIPNDIKNEIEVEKLGPMEILDLYISNDLLLRKAFLKECQHRYYRFNLGNHVSFVCFYYDYLYSNNVSIQNEINYIGDELTDFLTSTKFPIKEFQKEKRVDLWKKTEKEELDLFERKIRAIALNDQEEARKLLRYFPFDERLHIVIHPKEKSSLVKFLFGPLEKSLEEVIEVRGERKRIKDILKEELKVLLKGEDVESIILA